MDWGGGENEELLDSFLLAFTAKFPFSHCHFPLSFSCVNAWVPLGGGAKGPLFSSINPKMGLSRECGLCAMRGRLAVGPRELWPTSALNHSFSSPFCAFIEEGRRVGKASRMRVQVHTFSFIQWPHPAVSLLHFHHYNSSPLPSFYSPIPLLILLPAGPHPLSSCPHLFPFTLPRRLPPPSALGARIDVDGRPLGPAVYFEAHFGPGSIPPGSSRPSPPPSSPSHFPANHFLSLHSRPPSIPFSSLLSILISSSLNHSSLSSPFYLLPAEPPNFPTAAFFFCHPPSNFQFFLAQSSPSRNAVGQFSPFSKK